VRKQWVEQGDGGRGNHDIVQTAAVIGFTPKRGLSSHIHPPSNFNQGTPLGIRSVEDSDGLYIHISYHRFEIVRDRPLSQIRFANTLITEAYGAPCRFAHQL